MEIYGKIPCILFFHNILLFLQGNYHEVNINKLPLKIYVKYRIKTIFSGRKIWAPYPIPISKSKRKHGRDEIQAIESDICY